MKKIDLYIIRKFLKTFFFILGLILAIAIIFDVTEKLDDFLKHDVPLSEIIYDYYVNFIFFYGNLFSPLFIFLAVIIFTSSMAYKSEIIAILSAGVSFQRLMFPYFLAATFLAIISLWLNHFTVPHASRERVAFEQAYVGYRAKDPNKNLHKQIKPGHYIYVESYNVDRASGYKFSYEIIEGSEIKSKFMSQFMTWDSLNQHWIMRRYQHRYLDDKEEEVLVTGNILDTIMPFDPKEFEHKDYNIQMMDTPELNKFIDDEALRGSELLPVYKVEKYQRTALPLATYILTLIGVSFASRKVRGGIGLHIAISIGISFSYILAMQVTKVYAVNAGLNPFIAVWLPNIFFGILAIYFYVRAPK
ncbi:MAG TPA: hypothetical protein DDX92_09980 [Flavobacteriales bacterium]|jgi:lipopolysaccharide export system permease protein|nr:hypothetical protein [Flavobacteriales bacterium]